ncbi:MAG: hypothetical protein Q8R17_02755 [bacterium]|nr:hypothetical protein [bacterium]
MESGTIKTALAGAVVLIALALGAWFAFAPRGGGITQSEPRAQNGRRAEILELASRGARVSDSEKKRLFEYLSGEQFRAYQFNDRERALILKAIGG